MLACVALVLVLGVLGAGGLFFCVVGLVWLVGVVCVVWGCLLGAGFGCLACGGLVKGLL